MDFNILGVKIGISSHKATQFHLNRPDKKIKSCLTSLTSTMEFNYNFCRINHLYDALYRHRSFMNWFIGDGME